MTKEHSESSMTPTVSADVIERMARALYEFDRERLRHGVSNRRVMPHWSGALPESREAYRERATAALEASGLIEALAAVLVRDAAFRGDCGCIGLSRDAEREYETGQCPHQKGRDLLGLSLADCRAASIFTSENNND